MPRGLPRGSLLRNLEATIITTKPDFVGSISILTEVIMAISDLYAVLPIQERRITGNSPYLSGAPRPMMELNGCFREVVK